MTLVHTTAEVVTIDFVCPCEHVVCNLESALCYGGCHSVTCIVIELSEGDRDGAKAASLERFDTDVVWCHRYLFEHMVPKVSCEGIGCPCATSADGT